MKRFETSENVESLILAFNFQETLRLFISNSHHFMYHNNSSNTSLDTLPFIHFPFHLLDVNFQFNIREMF